jgi:DNA-binding winged helix-turn-helix (wHTH) protein
MARGVREVLKMIGRNPQFVAFGQFRFAPEEGLWRDDTPVPMPPRAIGVLAALLAAPGSIVSKQQLMDAVWPGTFVTESSLLEAIGLVRDALGDDRRNPTYIQTVHRRGYRFIAAVAPAITARPASESWNSDKSEAPAQLDPPDAFEPVEPFFSGPQWRPIVLACATYALTTVCVAIVFAIFGQRPVERRADVTRHPASAAVADPSAARSWPSWTPEGIEIAFAFSKAGPFNTAGAWDAFPTSVSPDGQLLVYAATHPMSGADIWLLDRRTRARRALVRSWSDETFARFAPDGQSIAFMSNISGRWEVYVQSLTGSMPVRVSSGGGLWPSWSTEGATLYFTANDATMAALIETRPALSAKTPVIAEQGGIRAHGRADLRVVLDWFAELARVRPS